MAEALEVFTFRTGPQEKRPARFTALLDGKIWKVHPDEYDYDSPKQLISAIRREAVVAKLYVQTAVTLSGHAVIRRRPLDYVARPGRRAALADAGPSS